MSPTTTITFRSIEDHQTIRFISTPESTGHAGEVTDIIRTLVRYDPVGGSCFLHFVFRYICSTEIGNQRSPFKAERNVPTYGLQFAVSIAYWL